MMLMMYDKEGGELKYGNKTAFCSPPWTESDEEKKNKEEEERKELIANDDVLPIKCRRGEEGSPVK